MQQTKVFASFCNQIFFLQKINCCLLIWGVAQNFSCSIEKFQNHIAYKEIWVVAMVFSYHGLYNKTCKIFRRAWLFVKTGLQNYFI